jgi:UDP-N-acetylmuramyl pentapeptide phosphotransferase/UDP-N-acetylglucosamine-1-phosphate transferase
MSDLLPFNLGVLLSFAVGAVLSFTITPALARKASQVGLMATDLHKPLRPQMPDLGGIAVVTNGKANASSRL